MTPDDPADPTAEHGDCSGALHELYEYLDGELTEERRTLIAAHLDGCSTCLGVYDFEADLRRVVAERCRDSVPESLRLRIARIIQIEQ